MDKNGFPELKDAGMMTWTSKKNGVVQVRTSAKQQPLSELAGMLEQNLSAPVMDRTGLNGRYDFTLAYSVEGGGASPESLATLAQAGAWFPRGPLEVPILSDALQEQLGLTLEKTKVAVELLVIDSAEKAPSKH
jgi:uncharacterized protein (TIGR03435 family)